MPQLSFKLLKYFIFSAKIFFTIFLIIALFIRLGGVRIIDDFVEVGASEPVIAAREAALKAGGNPKAGFDTIM